MKTCVVTLAAVILVAAASPAYAANKTITMNSIDANGVGKKVGTLGLSDTKAGLQITPRLTDLPAGDHGFHVHVNPDCGPGGGPNGQPAAGMAAGGHYDPANSGKHLGPQGEGHRGDMPVLTVETSGKATKAVTVPHLTQADV
jgi:Cu-Zn family superoxide dismutase